MSRVGLPLALTLVVAVGLAGCQGGTNPYQIAGAVQQMTQGAGDLRGAFVDMDEPEEVELGRSVTAMVGSRYPVLRDPALTRYVANVGNTVAAVSDRPDLRYYFAVLDTPERIADLLREENRLYDVEHFQDVLLNTRRKLIRVEQISQGTLDTILVHPREVFKLAIAANASAVVLVHNHPSGDPTPSEADIKVTRDLIRAGHLLKIEVLDHVIIGKRTAERAKDFLSLRELGYFYS